MVEADAAINDALWRIQVILPYTQFEVGAMKKLRLGTGVLTGGLLTAALTSVMYLANKLVDLPFIPYEFFDWITRILPGGLVTFGIDLMIDTMLMINMSVADSAKTAEQIIANIQFVVMGAVVGAVYFAARRTWGFSGRGSGLVLGALFGLPMIAISVAIGVGSPVIGRLACGALPGVGAPVGGSSLDHQEEAEPEPVIDVDRLARGCGPSSCALAPPRIWLGASRWVTATPASTTAGRGRLSGASAGRPGGG